STPTVTSSFGFRPTTAAMVSTSSCTAGGVPVASPAARRRSSSRRASLSSASSSPPRTSPVPPSGSCPVQLCPLRGRFGNCEPGRPVAHLPRLHLDRPVECLVEHHEQGISHRSTKACVERQNGH